MIAFENVSFGYKRGINVLSGFSLEVPDSGKSTVLRLAMGLAKPGSGRITGTGGLAVSTVFQEDRLIPWKTVLENVALFADGADRAAYYLRALGLGDVLQSFPGELSGGMKRRVALARALAHNFDMLVLDEPFTGLDEAAKRNAIELVNRETAGKMLVLATHDLLEAEALGAEIIEL